MGWKIHIPKLHSLLASGNVAAMKRSCALGILVVLTATCILVPLAQARAPDWQYSSPDSVIGELAVSSTGDLIAATNDKVLFFTHTGSLLGKEPFGSTLVITPDG